MPKHICFFIGSVSNKGGTERITVSLVNFLEEHGYEISIISLYQDNTPFFEINPNIHTYSLFNKPKAYFLFLPYIVLKLYHLVKRKNINILINVDVILSLFSLPLKLLLPSLKIISWEHFNFKTNLGVKRRDWGRYLSQKYADAIVTLTQQDKIFYLNHNPFSKPIYAISNFLKNFPEKHADINEKNIIAIGRYTYQKGFDILIDIWKDVQENNYAHDWKLKIIGDGEDREVLVEKAQKLGLSTSIEFLPAQKNIADFYLTSSIYVMSSRYEGLPMVLLEALSFGLPIISFDCDTGPREIVKNEKNGYLIPLNDYSLFKQKIIYLMSHPEERLKMQNEALNYSRQYSINKIFTKWQVLLNKLLH